MHFHVLHVHHITPNTYLQHPVNTTPQPTTLTHLVHVMSRAFASNDPPSPSLSLTAAAAACARLKNCPTVVSGVSASRAPSPTALTSLAESVSSRM